MSPTASFRFTALAATLAASAALSACAPLLLGGAFFGGTMVAVDRRSSGAQIDDQSIELKSIGRINEAMGDRGYVSVTSYNHLVLITGEMPSEADKATVGQVVSRIDAVKGIVNEIEIAPISSFANHSNDSLLTSKVKASMVDAKDLQSGAFKVVTEREIVYLMGRVTEREATRASDLARGVSGVRKVVRVFEIVSEAELADLQTKPASTAASAPRP
jgi:osmotically-inducible protein OsmY